MFENILEIRPQCEIGRIFLHNNRARTKREECFKNQNLGRSFSEKSVKTVFNEVWVNGCGLNENKNNHWLRDSIGSLLVEAGETYSSIILWTYQFSATTLARYQNVMGSEDLFSANST